MDVFDNLSSICTGTYSGCLGVQAVAYRVIDTKRSVVQVLITPYVHCWSIPFFIIGSSNTCRKYEMITHSILWSLIQGLLQFTDYIYFRNILFPFISGQSKTGSNLD
jgi:hypothetical protein